MQTPRTFFIQRHNQLMTSPSLLHAPMHAPPTHPPTHSHPPHPPTYPPRWFFYHVWWFATVGHMLKLQTFGTNQIGVWFTYVISLWLHQVVWAFSVVRGCLLGVLIFRGWVYDTMPPRRGGLQGNNLLYKGSPNNGQLKKQRINGTLKKHTT